MDNTLRDASSSSTQLPSDGHTPSTSQSETPMCFDTAWLKAVGLVNLQPETAKGFLQAARFRLEMAVGIKIRQRLSDAEADELEALIDRDDQAQVTSWLKVHIPDQEEIVREQFQILTEAVRAEFAQLINRETAPQSE